MKNEVSVELSRENGREVKEKAERVRGDLISILENAKISGKSLRITTEDGRGINQTKLLIEVSSRDFDNAQFRDIINEYINSFSRAQETALKSTISLFGESQFTGSADKQLTVPNMTQSEIILRIVPDREANFTDSDKIQDMHNNSYSYLLYLKKRFSLSKREESNDESRLREYAVSTRMKTSVLSMPSRVKKSDKWIERRTELRLLKENIEQGRIIVLSGIAGSGKTQIARSLLSELDYKDVIFFEFYLDTLADFEKGCRNLITKLNTSLEIDFSNLSVEKLLDEIQMQLDYEFSDHQIYFLFDNVDKDEQITFVNKFLTKLRDANRVNYRIIITSQKQNAFEKNYSFDLNLTAGFTLDQALERISNINLKAKQLLSDKVREIDFTKTSDNIDAVIIYLNQLKSSFNEVDRVLLDQSTQLLLLIQLFGGLPLGLSIAANYLSADSAGTVEDFIEKVNERNKETRKFIEDIAFDVIGKDYEKSKGACSQLSAIKLMIERMNLDFLWREYLNTVVPNPSDILCALSFFSNIDIPDLIIRKMYINAGMPDKDAGLNTDRFIRILEKNSLILSAQQVDYYENSKNTHVRLLSLHGQTLLAASAMISDAETERKEKAIEQSLSAIQFCNDDKNLGIERNIIIKNLISGHFFRVLELLAKDSKEKIRVIPILQRYHQMVLNCFDANYQVSWPIIMLEHIESNRDAQITNSDDGSNAKDEILWLILKIKIFENYFDCWAESKREKDEGWRIQKVLVIKYLTKVLNPKFSEQLVGYDRYLIYLSSIRILAHINKSDDAIKELDAIIEKTNVSNFSDESRTTISLIIKKLYLYRIDFYMTSRQFVNALDLFKSGSLTSDFTSVESEFKKASIFLHKGDYLEAKHIFTELLKQLNSSLFHGHYLEEDIKIGLYISMIKNNEFNEVSKIIRIDQAVSVQISYLVCLANTLKHQKLFRNSGSRTSKEDAEFNEILTLTKQWHEHFSEICSKVCAVYPCEYYLLGAYIAYEMKDYEGAISYHEKFNGLRRVDVEHQMEAYSTKYSRRFLYFFPKNMTILMRENVYKLLNPNYIYFRSLNKTNKFRLACDAVVEQIIEPWVDSERKINSYLKDLYKTYETFTQENKPSYSDYCQLSDRIKSPRRTIMFYFNRGRIGLKFPAGASRVKIASEFQQALSTAKMNFPEKPYLPYMYLAEVYLDKMKFSEMLTFDDYDKAEIALDDAKNCIAKFDESEKYIERAKKLRLQCAHYFMSASAKQFFQRAINCFLAVLDLELNNQVALENLAKLELLRNNYEKAVDYYETVIPLMERPSQDCFTNYAESLWKSAEQDIKDKNFTFAIDKLRKAKQYLPDNIDVLKNLLEAYAFYEGLFDSKYYKEIFVLFWLSNEGGFSKNQLEMFYRHSSKFFKNNLSEDGLWLVEQLYDNEGMIKHLDLDLALDFLLLLNENINFNRVQIAKLVFIITTNAKKLIDTLKPEKEVIRIKKSVAEICRQIVFKLWHDDNGNVLKKKPNQLNESIKLIYVVGRQLDPDNNDLKKDEANYKKYVDGIKKYLNECEEEYKSSLTPLPFFKTAPEEPARKYFNALIDAATLETYPEAAIPYYERAKEIFPQERDLRENLAILYFKINKYREVLETLSIIPLQDLNFIAKVVYGLAKFKNFNLKEAYDFFYQQNFLFVSEEEKYQFNYLKAVIFLGLSQFESFALPAQVSRVDFISIYKTQFDEFIKMNKSIDQSITIINYPQLNCNFYYLYSKFLHFQEQIFGDPKFQQSAKTMRINDINTLLSEINNAIKEATEKKSIDRVSNEQISRFLNNLNKLRNNLQILLNFLNEESKNCTTLWKIRRLEQVISKSINEYNINKKSTWSATFLPTVTEKISTSYATLKFITVCWPMCNFSADEDLFGEKRILRYYLLLQWYRREATKKATLREALEKNLESSNIQILYQIQNDLFVKNVELSLTQYIDIPSYRSTTDSGTYLDILLKIMFTIPEENKAKEYHMILKQYFTEDNIQESNLQKCFERHGISKDSIERSKDINLTESTDAGSHDESNMSNSKLAKN